MKNIMNPMWPKKLLMALIAMALSLAAWRAQSEEVDIKEKIPAWRKSAQEGDKDAQYRIGLCYLIGKGVSKDQAKAVACFQIAANGGHAGAQYQLGNCYNFGWGITENQSEAKRWHEAAAKQGYVEPADYLTAEEVKSRWLADMPTPRSLDTDYKKIMDKNSAFTSEVRVGRHDLRAELEAAVHNKGEALRVGDKERVDFYQKQIEKLTPVTAEITSRSSLSKTDLEALKNAYEKALFQQYLYVSFKHEQGWTAPVSKMVSFLSEELGDDFVGCALFPSDDNGFVVVKVNVSDQLDYLLAFIPTNAVRGKELIPNPEREWLFAAQWPAPIAAHDDLRGMEAGFLKKDDRASAAEIKMMIGDKIGCMRHMRILKRDYLRKGERVKAARIDILLLSSQQ